MKLELIITAAPSTVTVTSLSHTPATQCILFCRHYFLQNRRLDICNLFSMLKAAYETHLFNMPMGDVALPNISCPYLATYRAPVGKHTALGEVVFPQAPLLTM